MLLFLLLLFLRLLNMQPVPLLNKLPQLLLLLMDKLLQLQVHKLLLLDKLLTLDKLWIPPMQHLLLSGPAQGVIAPAAVILDLLVQGAQLLPPPCPTQARRGSSLNISLTASPDREEARDSERDDTSLPPASPTLPLPHVSPTSSDSPTSPVTSSPPHPGPPVTSILPTPGVSVSVTSQTFPPNILTPAPETPLLLPQ